MDLVNFKRLIFKNNNVNFNNELFMNYFIKESENYDYSIWFTDDYHIYKNYDAILTYLNNLKGVKKLENVDYVEKVSKKVDIKYRIIKGIVYKIVKNRSVSKVDGYHLTINKNITTKTTVSSIPDTFKSKVKKVYYIINDYIEVVLTKYNKNEFENNFVKINIINKDLWDDNIFISLMKTVFNLYCIIFSRTSVFSTSFEDSLKSYFKIKDLKSNEQFLTFESIVNGYLIDNNSGEKTYKPPNQYYSYNIVNSNDNYVLYNSKYKFIISYNISSESINVIPLDVVDIWFTSSEELEILHNLNIKVDNYLFGAYIDYTKEKAYIYDVFEFENMSQKIYDIPYKHRYNYISSVISKFPTTSFVFEKIQITPISAKEKIFESFKYMIDTGSIGVKYVSNQKYSSQRVYNWIYTNNIKIPLYVKDGVAFLKKANEYEKVDFNLDISYTENRNYMFQYIPNENKLVQLFDDSPTVSNYYYFMNFLKYIQFIYSPQDVVEKNNFDITLSILWKLQINYNLKYIKSLAKVDEVYKKGFIPVVSDISLFNNFMEKYSDSGLKVGFIYIDYWKYNYLNYNENDIKEISLCKLVNIDKFVEDFRDNFNINFDDYLNFSYINNIPNIISIFLITLSKQQYQLLTEEKMSTETKITFSDLKNFAKHYKLRKNISILKKSEITDLIQSNGYTLDDVKKFIETENTEKKKIVEQEEDSSCSEKAEACENSEFTQYMYSDTEMEIYRKYVRQCTSQLKQTAYKRNLIESMDYSIDRKSLICLLVKKQCKSDTKLKPVVKKTKVKLQSVFPDETFKIVKEIYKTEDQPYQCKGFNIINYRNLLLLRNDNFDLVEFMMFTSDGFNFLGNNEKDMVIKSFKSLVKNCIDNSLIYNIQTHEIFNITQEYEIIFNKTLFMEINKVLSSENLITMMVLYSLFMGIYINVYEYTDQSNAKLMFSSLKLPQLYKTIDNIYPKDIKTYNIILFSNTDKFDYGFHVQKIKDTVKFSSNLLVD